MIEPSTAGTHVWWLGQSGFLIGSDGRHLLVDPYLSDSLTAKYEGTETPHVRLTPPVVDPERLTFVDVVLSTHGHTDHLDGETLRAIGAPLVAPAGIVELARERSGGEVTAISEGEIVEAGGFRIEAVPAVHPGEHCVGYVIGAGDAPALSLGRHHLARPRRPRRRRRLPPDQRQARQSGRTGGGTARPPGRGCAGRPLPLRHVRVQHCDAGRLRRRVRAARSALPRAFARGAAHAGLRKRKSASATQAGFCCPSSSIVAATRACLPPVTASTSSIVKRPRMRAPDGTGEVKRTRLRP